MQYILLAITAAIAALASPLKARDNDPSNDSNYQHFALLHHNVHRANHSASDLTWNDGLADAAKQVASSCKWGHDESPQWSGGAYGQNIQASSNFIGDVVTGSWYNGEFADMAPYFGQADVPSDVFEKVGHLTQVVWYDTTEVGCYTKDCTDEGGVSPFGTDSGVAPYFTVCNYGPPGNYGGQFADQVKKPLGHDTVYADYTG